MEKKNHLATMEKNHVEENLWRRTAATDSGDDDEWQQ